MISDMNTYMNIHDFSIFLFSKQIIFDWLRKGKKRGPSTRNFDHLFTPKKNFN